MPEMYHYPIVEAPATRLEATLIDMTEKRLVANDHRLVAAECLERDRERLAALLPGGSAARPVEVVSASVIEGHAADAMPCPHCGGQYRVHEHTRPTPRLRELEVACRRCGITRTLWFTIVADELN